MYLTFEEYLQYGGTLDETTFNSYAFEADSLVDWYTFNRLQKESSVSEKVKKCVYALILIINTKNSVINASSDLSQSFQAGISSQSNDGVSVSYNVLNASQLMDLSKNEIEGIIKRYLQGEVNSLGRKLLYRGIYPNE